MDEKWLTVPKGSLTSEHYVITLEELHYLAAEVEKLQRITEKTCQQKIQEYQGGVL